MLHISPKCNQYIPIPLCRLIQGISFAIHIFIEKGVHFLGTRVHTKMQKEHVDFEPLEYIKIDRTLERLLKIP